MIEKSNVKIICTTDDPIDSLEFHKKIKEDKNFKTRDKVMSLLWEAKRYRYAQGVDLLF